MKFVTVRHEDGREAEITQDEVKQYREMGFKPVDGAVDDRPGSPAVAASQPAAPANGTDQRLDLVLEELRGLRADLAATYATVELDALEPQDGETVQLREPGTGSPTDQQSDSPNLDGMTRDELNAHAATVGVAEPESFKTKADLIAAIEGTQPPQD